MRSSKIMLAIAMVGLAPLALLDECHGQGRMRMMRTNPTLSQLLSMEVVQKDLELTEDEVEAMSEMVQELSTEQRELQREAFTNMRELETDDERREAMQELQQSLAKFREKEVDQFSEHLDQKQLDRLKQIGIQARGPAAFLSKDVAEALDISEDQTEEIRTATSDFQSGLRDKMMELMQEGDREGAMNVLREETEKLTKTIMGVLSDDQRKKFDEMIGKKIEIPRMRRGNRRPRNDF